MGDPPEEEEDGDSLMSGSKSRESLISRALEDDTKEDGDDCHHRVGDGDGHGHDDYDDDWGCGRDDDLASLSTMETEVFRRLRDRRRLRVRGGGPTRPRSSRTPTWTPPWPARR